MKYLGDFLANATVRGSFNTRSSAGAPITLAGTPALSVYKDGDVAETTTGVTLTVDFDSRTGHHLFAIATTDAFYATGSDFRIVITTGTVDGVSVVGVEVGTFSIQNRSALVTLGANAPANWINNAALANDAITDAKVASDVTVGANVLAINSSSLATVRLALSAAQIIPGTVTNAGFTPTSIEFEASDIAEATNDHFNGRIVIFTSGSLSGQATELSDYSLSGGRGHFTVVAMTEAPVNNDTFIIV